MFKGSSPADTDYGSALVAQLLGNDVINKLVDDTAVLASGLTRGNVVKWSAANARWELCDGTIALASSDVIGIVEYVNGTAGQVRVAGVYTDTNGVLAANTAYYCQSNGTLGTTVTKVSLGRTTSAGRLVMPSGGGAISAATTTSLGGIIVGNGLSVDEIGKLSIVHDAVLLTANTTFVVPVGVTKLKVTCVGGAGGGGGGALSYAGGNGATGYVETKVITVTPGESIACTIGAGGNLGAKNSSSGTTNGYTGGTGGLTSFGTYVSANGGPGGQGGQGNNMYNGANALSYAYRIGIFNSYSIGGTGGGVAANGVAGTAGLILIEY